MYKRQDYTCLDAYSGTEARLVLQQTNVSLVLLDLMLPGISGEALLKELKLKQLPVIVLSAKDAIDDRVALLNEGADDYLCKPFDLKELKARIQVQPVSYTHLDVYKRQRKGLWATSGFQDMNFIITNKRLESAGYPTFMKQYL